MDTYIPVVYCILVHYKSVRCVCMCVHVHAHVSRSVCVSCIFAIASIYFFCAHSPGEYH